MFEGSFEPFTCITILCTFFDWFIGIEDDMNQEVK